MSNYSTFPFVDSFTQLELSLLTLPYFTALFVINLPAIAIVLNGLRQWIIPQDPNHPPIVFHWIPFIGSAVAYGTDPVNFLSKCRDKYGNIFTITVFGRRMTVAVGPKGSNFVLGGKLSEVSAEDAYTALTTPVFGAGVVFDCPNHVLMEQKKFVKVGLSMENFCAYVPMIVNEVEDFLDQDPAFNSDQSAKTNCWGVFPAYIKMAEITILTAACTLQGREIRAALDKGFADRYHDLDGGFTPLNLMFPNLPLPSYRRRDIAQKAMSDFYVDIIRKRKAEGRLKDESDMMTALCAQSYKDGRAVTEREVAHMLTALLMAGQHTSSTSGTWALLHIAADPDVAQALYEEQIENFSNDDGSLRPLTYEELKKLPLLNSVIRETLRVHPPIHSIMRKVISDMTVPSTLAAHPVESRTYVVPKGHYVMACPALTHMDNQFWKNPETWDPCRWADASGVAAQAQALYDGQGGEKVDYGFGQISKGTESMYQPFGAGRHRCIGEQFAYLQLSTILATLVRKLELRIEKKIPEHNYHTLITQPKGPCGIRYRRRQSHEEFA
ncbi:lanosterol 14-alpha-demethylase [Ramaria rubella]|nr:lanosterol 14-alpha-demethylase [Ramaria rubella]